MRTRSGPPAPQTQARSAARRPSREGRSAERLCRAPTGQGTRCHPCRTPADGGTRARVGRSWMGTAVARRCDAIPSRAVCCWYTSSTWSCAPLPTWKASVPCGPVKRLPTLPSTWLTLPAYSRPSSTHPWLSPSSSWRHAAAAWDAMAAVWCQSTAGRPSRGRLVLWARRGDGLGGWRWVGSAGDEAGRARTRLCASRQVLRCTFRLSASVMGGSHGSPAIAARCACAPVCRMTFGCTPQHSTQPQIWQHHSANQYA